jgi:hypothetical protein
MSQPANIRNDISNILNEKFSSYMQTGEIMLQMQKQERIMCYNKVNTVNAGLIFKMATS